MIDGGLKSKITLPINPISTYPKPNFEEIKIIDSSGNEVWNARDLMPLLGYKAWANFEKVVEKAKQSIAKVYPQINDHFAESNKMIKLAAGTNKESIRTVKDYKLSRYACYVIAQNGDSSKAEIAYAQSYFAIQTRKQEVMDEFEKSSERIKAREKLKETEKEFSGVLQAHQVDSFGIAEIRSSGDEALFNMPTHTLKQRYGINKNKPIADHLPTIAIKAKELATEMTTFNTENNNLQGKDVIKREHVHNNQEVRKLLTDNGIYLERIAPEEDISKLRRRINDDELLKLENTPSSINEITINICEVFDQNELVKISQIIRDHTGTDSIHILYGNINEPQKITRPISVNSDLISLLKKFIVL